MMRRRIVSLAAAAALIPALAGCGAQYSGGGEGPLKGAQIAFGSKDFTEQKVLGQIAVQYLRSQGADVWDQTGLVSSQAVRSSIERGDIDANWEYTGTAWITYLGNAKPIAETKAQFEAVKKQDEEENGLSWIDPAPLNNTYALAIKRSKAEELGITKLSDLKELVASPKGKDLTLCVESEFANRPDGLPGLQKTYGLKFTRDNTKRLDTGLIYSQTGNGTCTFGEVFTTDGRIQNLDLLTLEDDKKFFPIYQAALNIRTEVLGKHPQIERIMEPVARRLTTKTMQRLNGRVDIEGVLPDKVAREWLQDEGLIPKD
ncbi:glycine betaine ABC transporter substrate-binding protein [Patulibacter americanus]|uniref:glycine betaine ABC transporter substrate-binding protein n=1 Tax=Patulibacter americanus TaxID=588672 RepID=UPI001B7FB701|nr:glycine betaine ABC transporter substrate-binding protein [Patulibacter americanus]